MYNLTQEDFLKIKAEAYDPDPGEEAFAHTFRVMEEMFPGYLYARRSSFPCAEDLEDCLVTAQIRIIERIRRYYFDREDMAQTPESLQRWMFVVLKNCHYSVLRQSSAGREVLQRLQQKTAAETGMTYGAEGRLNVEGADSEPGGDGGFDALYRKEETAGMRELLSCCFSEILTGKSDVQIVLAWLTVGALMLCRDMKKKDAIALIADTDPTMEQLFHLLRRMMSRLPWIGLQESDWDRLEQRLQEEKRDGVPVGQLKFGDFTDQSPREYISKSINKRNSSLSSRHADQGAEFDF